MKEMYALRKMFFDPSTLRQGVEAFTASSKYVSVMVNNLGSKKKHIKKIHIKILYKAANSERIARVHENT